MSWISELNKRIMTSTYQPKRHHHQGAPLLHKKIPLHLVGFEQQSSIGSAEKWSFGCTGPGVAGKCLWLPYVWIAQILVRHRFSKSANRRWCFAEIEKRVWNKERDWRMSHVTDEWCHWWVWEWTTTLLLSDRTVSNSLLNSLFKEITLLWHRIHT